MAGTSEPRHRVGIVTDAAAGLAPSWLDEWRSEGRLACLDLPVLVDGVPDSGETGIERRLAVATAEGATMSTSRPSPAAFAAAYSRLAEAGYTDVVSIHLSGELSGTVDAARSAAREAPVPVHVIDTRTVAMAQGFAVESALAAARAGIGPTGVVRAVEATLDRARLLFYVPTLERLARSGRIPKGLARVGQMFRIKPIATVVDGRLRYLERPRQESAALRRFTELVLEDAAQAIADDAVERHVPEGQGRAEVALHDFYGTAMADSIHQWIERRFGEAVVVHRLGVPPVLAVHTGLGPVAAIAIPRAVLYPRDEAVTAR